MICLLPVTLRCVPALVTFGYVRYGWFVYRLPTLVRCVARWLPLFATLRLGWIRCVADYTFYVAPPFTLRCDLPTTVRLRFTPPPPRCVYTFTLRWVTLVALRWISFTLHYVRLRCTLHVVGYVTGYGYLPRIYVALVTVGSGYIYVLPPVAVLFTFTVGYPLPHTCLLPRCLLPTLPVVYGSRGSFRCTLPRSPPLPLCGCRTLFTFCGWIFTVWIGPHVYIYGYLHALPVAVPHRVGYLPFARTRYVRYHTCGYCGCIYGCGFPRLRLPVYVAVAFVAVAFTLSPVVPRIRAFLRCVVFAVLHAHGWLRCPVGFWIYYGCIATTFTFAVGYTPPHRYICHRTTFVLVTTTPHTYLLPTFYVYDYRTQLTRIFTFYTLHFTFATTTLPFPRSHGCGCVAVALVTGCPHHTAHYVGCVYTVYVTPHVGWVTGYVGLRCRFTFGCVTTTTFTLIRC